MITFHPDDNMLAEYAAGALDTALCISVKAHLSMCSKCRKQLGHLQAIGAAFLESGTATTDIQGVPHEETEGANFASLMERIRSLPSAEAHSTHQVKETASNSEAAKTSASTNSDLPPIVRKLISKNPIQWRRVSPSLREAQLKTGQNRYEVCLHKIAKGKKAAEHDHRGKEVTVVLQGSFSDENGTYSVGDFVMREPGQIHRPTASQNQDCLCLSVIEAPVKLTGLTGMIVNPFLSFQPG